jgi:tetratricopeptide (TPR) repeat protein
MTETEAADAQASLLMQEGIRLRATHNAQAALLCFDRALDLRRRLPAGVPVCAYHLAACWLNRAEALTAMGPAHQAQTLCSYNQALLLLHKLPLDSDARFPRRLAIAHQNRALLLAAQTPPGTGDAIVGLVAAIAVLDRAKTMDTLERDHLRAVVWTNLANIQSSEDTVESDLAAWQAAERALDLVMGREAQVVEAAEIGLKARHVLCRIAARRLSSLAEVHVATDLADDGLDLVSQWERRGIDTFRALASDLFRFGGMVYARYQPHFLNEFLRERLDPQRSADSYVQSPEMQDVAQEIVRLLPIRP